LSRAGDGARERFPRSARLLNGAAYGRVFKRAERSSNRDFTVLTRPNDHGRARLGMAVSKKVSAKAVVRNRIKRVIRESFRRHQAELDGLDVVVIGKAGAAIQRGDGLRRSLEGHWARIAKTRHRPAKD
jgi:ribonuclease P protein component